MDKLPNVLIVEQDKKGSSSPLRKLLPGWLISFRTLYLILGIIIVVESILGIQVLVSKVPQKNILTPQNQPTESKISLIAENKTVKVGDTIPVTIELTTGSHTSNGADIVLKYDPKLISVDEKTGFSAGNIFAEYPGLKIDNTKGLIEVSGISSPNGGDFKGTGNFAEIKFKTKAKGNTKISLDFNKGSTTDTNVIDNQSGEDILSSVGNLDLTIQ